MRWFPYAARFTFALTILAAGFADPSASAADPVDARFYMVDVGHGNAVFAIAPSGAVMLMDTGAPFATDRLLAFMSQNDIAKIDYLLVSHYHSDHMGGAARIAEKFPVLHFVDHGDSVEYGRDDNWWRQRRGPWFHDGMGKRYDESFDEYRAARAKSQHLVVKAGDSVPLKGLDVDVVCSAGQIITRPLAGSDSPGAAPASYERRGDDDAEDAQSIGVVIRHGKFRLANFGDLTWNTANTLFCPQNLVGTVDAYIVTHHAQSFPRSMGDYYWGLSACPPAEVRGLNPRVALLTMGNEGHKGGTPEAMQNVLSVPGLDLWQTQYIRGGGEKGHNGSELLIADLGEKSEKVPCIALVAHADGSFTVTNTRNGFTKEYPSRSASARLP